ncbi:MAG: DUF6261 family protein [Prevotellaceae bacterium]|jgi:hypothetical protein|nr:DUF6261 family protein [Prevotellaceae bacterium]
MKKILNSPDENRYNTSEHLEFHTLSYKICDRYKVQINAPAMLATYQSKLAQEETVFKWLRKSEFTAKKEEVDRARDRVFTGLLAVVRNDMKHFNPAIRDKALHVYSLLETYGNLPRASYDAETANIDSLVTRLHGSDYTAAVEALKLEAWIDELNSQNELFKSYVDDAAQEQVNKPAISARTARHETDDALKQITNRIASLIILNGEGEFTAFVEEFNVLVSHYNTLVHEHYGRIHARIDLTPSTVAPIGVQQYTGKPVFVIPELTLTVTKEGKETVVTPVFSKDFTVAYKNNINPGTATLTIQGIGKYTGEITTTFNIVES